MVNRLLNKVIQVFTLSQAKVVLGKTYSLLVRVVDFQRNKPVKNVNVKVSSLITEGIPPEQWAENLKNGSPFKSLILSISTDDNGVATAELPEGAYEAKVEQYNLSKNFDLTQNVEILFTQPKKLHWWQRS